MRKSWSACSLSITSAPPCSPGIGYGILYQIPTTLGLRIRVLPHVRRGCGIVQSSNMKTVALSAFLSILCVPLSILAQAAPPSCPTAIGAYYLQGADWTPMDPSHSIGFKTTNVAGAAFSYGAAKARIKAQFRDPRSPYQLRSNLVAICLVGITDTGRDITLAKFQEEKDRREISMASYRLWTGVNAQIDPKVLIPVSVEKEGDKIYLVTSKDAVPVGEFILFTIIPDVAAMAKANTASSLGGYDFGSHAK
jgi:hypothetical protein